MTIKKMIIVFISVVLMQQPAHANSDIFFDNIYNTLNYVVKDVASGCDSYQSDFAKIGLFSNGIATSSPCKITYSKDSFKCPCCPYPKSVISEEYEVNLFDLDSASIFVDDNAVGVYCKNNEYCVVQRRGERQKNAPDMASPWRPVTRNSNGLEFVFRNSSEANKSSQFLHRLIGSCGNYSRL